MKAYYWVYVSGRDVHIAKTHQGETCLAQLRLNLRNWPVQLEVDDPDGGNEPCYTCERDRLEVK